MYGETLIDPTDNPPSLLKTTFKFIELTLGYFNDTSEGVTESAAKTIIEIQKYVLKGQTMEHQISLVFLPLMSMVNVI